MNESINGPAARKPLRLWPAVVVVVLQWLFWAIVPVAAPQIGGAAVLGGIGGGLVILLWWLFFSRAPWLERLGALVLMIVAVMLTSRLVHESIANGMMGFMLPVYAIPLLCLALVASLLVGRRFSDAGRRAVMVVAIAIACGAMTLVRTGGISGEADSDLHLRWTPTPEERLLAHSGDEPAGSPRPSPAEPSPAATAAAAADRPAPEKPGEVPAVSAPGAAAVDAAASGVAPAAGAAASATADISAADRNVEWPGFRGAARDSVVRGVRIATDWASQPPTELWRRPIGPGWSSFAVHGDLVYTQEQRGNDEIVACYRLSSGQPVWKHRDAARFWESNAGAGPRATPTLDNGRVYALGGTGILNALDARNGSLIWSRNAATDTNREIPDWGIAGSPIVVGGLVVVAITGQLVAYDVRTGNQRWLGPGDGGGYSSPHLATIDGVPQILLLRGRRTVSVAPADGTLLWEHSWEPNVSILQPAVTGNGDVFITGGDGMGGMGIRRLAVARGSSGWTVQDRWTSRGLKPYFNDFVVHKGHAYGFDGSILASINLEDGNRVWKGGRYGHGQLVLLADQDLLLILSEEGELALVKAAPDQFTEVARFKAIEGKTWNHPVLVGDRLLVRNGEEMAAFRLPLAGR